jgi:hypothetical protein
MALRTRITEDAANAQADAFGCLLDGGYITLYSGEQPESCDESPNSPEIAVMHMSNPAFDAANGGTITANAIAPAESADSDGDVSWFRAFSQDGHAVFDGSAGKYNCNLVLDDTRVRAGAKVSIKEFTYSVPWGKP